jgi:diguanylate cyclase (GGDEF)-like protein
MRLTRDTEDLERPRPFAVLWATAVVAGALWLIFELDRRTGSAPFQHRYYLPIILASLRLGRRAGLGAAVVAILLYHLANFARFTGYSDVDVVQTTLFVVVGIVTAKLSDDAHRLRHLATTDDLTGLHNLRSFEPRLVRMVRTSREKRTPLGMLVLDVDRLKTINDTYGHLAGAEAVRLVGHTLAAHLPPGAVACRYGGDEFAIAIPNCGRTLAGTYAEELRGAVHRVAPVLAGRPFAAGALSISLGLASLNDEDDSTPDSSTDCDADDSSTNCGSGGSSKNFGAAYISMSGGADLSGPRDDVSIGEMLFGSADKALYAAKQQGRNRVGGPLRLKRN